MKVLISCEQVQKDAKNCENGITNVVDTAFGNS